MSTENLYSGAAVEGLAARVRLHDVAAGGHAAREPDVAANYRPAPDGDPSEDGGACVDDDVVFHDRMPRQALHERAVLVDREALRSECHRLVEPHALADHSRLADDDAGAVVDEEARADLGAGMDVDARRGMCMLGDDAGDDRQIELVERVREPVMDDGLDAG